MFATMLAMFSPVFAQDVTVTVTPIQSVLPPQIMLYVTDPGNYFSITLSYTGNEPSKQVYLAMQAEQTNPSAGLSLSTPANRPPMTPIVVMPGQPRVLTSIEMRSMFNHIPLNEIQAPQGLFDNYANGSFGLLPEGQYEMHFTAYQWEKPTQANNGKIANPTVVSSPSGGYAYFNVCYNAQAPAFLTPALPNQGQELVPLTVAELDPATPQFTWKAPVVACNPASIQYTYTLRIVEVLPGQNPDNSMDYNPVVYQANQLTTPMCVIPFAVLKTMKQGTTYAAQLTATPGNTGTKMLNYVSVENNGKSPYHLFRLKANKVEPEPQQDKDQGGQGDLAQNDKNDDKVEPADDKGKVDDKDKGKDDKKDDKPAKDEDEDDEDGESDINVYMGNTEQGTTLTDSLYTFRNPRIIDPNFVSSAGVRKRFMQEGIEVSWEASQFSGGEGTQPDTIKIEYDLELFDNGERADKDEAVKQTPIFTRHYKDIKNLKDTIQWKDISETAEAGDYMVLRIKPVVANKKASVGFTGDDNVVDFAMCNRLSKQYFQCSNMVDIEDTQPTEKTAKDLKGVTVAIGEYQMIIDEISGDPKTGFKGKGRAIWEPFGAKIKICVQFDKLKINKDNIVYEGLAESYAGSTMSSMDVVDKLFSDWGIDNLMSESGIPYADMLGTEVKNKAKSLGENINIGKYYNDLQTAKGVLSLLTSGEMDNVYMPLKFPTDKLPPGFDVMQIQIADMKFAPTYATMNIIAQAKLPECNVLKDKVLIFGAPRVCISPSRFLPESGHIALLGDFTLTPTADFEMTFKAPENLLEPKNGCYLSWHADEFELLGLDVDLTIPGLVKEENGKLVKDAKTGKNVHPKMNITTSIASWNDFVVDVTMDDFQAEDLPGYSFHAQNVVFDLSENRNSPKMGKFPDKYQKAEAGIKGKEESWKGMYLGGVSVTFPKSLQFGDKGKDDTGDGKLGTKNGRLVVKAENMFIDKSGITVSLGAENIISAKSKKKGLLGGWGISLDKVGLEIIQNNFDNCFITGQLNVPIFDTNKDKDKFGNIDYTCEIRRLSNPQKNKQGESERTRFSYMFLTESIDDLDFSCFVAKATIDKDQTYFVVDAYDHATIEDSVVTNVELCMGGTIGIGLVDKANDWLKDKLPIDVKIPDIHFTKMRLSNKKRSDWQTENERVKEKRKTREAKEAAIAKQSILTIMKSEELSLGGGACYLDLGEWSLASAKKTIGPFSFSLDKFSPSYKDGKVKIDVGGTLGLVGDKVCVSTNLTVQANANISGTDFSKWKIEADKQNPILLNDISLKCDFAGALHLEGTLSIIRPGQGEGTGKDKGYKGSLVIDITGLFSLDCKGGFFEHAADDATINQMKADGEFEANEVVAADDKKYSWGYFMISIESGAGIQAPPVAINRIAGGFFFNCTPTQGAGKFGKFNGDPVAKYGSIGVALGLGMSTTAGEKALRADLDVLVVYDSQNKCLSTFMFNGKLEAVGGMIKADCSLVYENQIVNKVTQNRYLVLNVTVEAGMDTKGIMDQLDKVNAQLENLKGKLDDFQGKIDGVYQKVAGAACGMKAISGKNGTQGADVESGPADGDLSKMDTSDTADDKPNASAGTASSKTSGKPGFSAGETKISLEFKITWAKNGQTYSTPKWHLYLGEPEFDKRCSFTYLKIDAGIVKVDIGANAYICLGNELPNGGALPEIPSEITEFLAGKKSSSTDMAADLGKAQRSRAAAAKALLNPNSCEGGVMLGACAWGKIDIDLGLLYGKMGAMAGFDCSLVNYGDAAFCMNSGKKMGRNGWYAMGQLYAYLYAELGLHIKLGRLIDEKIKFFDFGIGGVLEVGLPNPTWVEGQARIKISLLGGLAKINKKFEFSAGDRCVPFRGNALDGFEMVSSVSHGSDSLYQALMDPTFAISANEAKNMTFSTISSIGSHYRLLDPSYQEDIANKLEITEEEMKEKLALNASRTYVFDITQDMSSNYGKMGVRLFDLGTGPTDWISWNGGEPLTEKKFYERMGKTGNGTWYKDMNSMVSSLLNTRESTVIETSKEMRGPARNSNAKGYLNNGEPRCYMLDYFLNNGFEDYSFAGVNLKLGVSDKTEKYCSFRETKGTMFHLTGMNVQPGHSYALFIQSDGYEIQNGNRVWCTYVDNGKLKYIQWRQAKAWFFRVKSNEEERIITDSLRNLQPYIALAYPSIDGTKVIDDRGVGAIPAYYNDICYPTIALNRDITTNLPASKMKWVLTPIVADTLYHKGRQVKNAKYINQHNCINLEPDGGFGTYSGFATARTQTANSGKTYDFSQEKYRLQLQYTYRHATRNGAAKAKATGQIYSYRDSTFNLVDLTVQSLPHGVTIKGKTYTDDWRTTTTKDINEVLPYSLPFVGARIYEHPKIDYEATMEKSSDDDIVFYNKKYNNTPLRLLDPYLYFAYLGKWTFIGDRTIDAYDFDDANVPFGSETLIYNYNGTTVNVEFLKNESAKSLWQVRNQMYDVWNTWNYNDSNQPYFPLPTLTKTVGGLTANNQDGKTSTVVPRNVNNFDDYTYCYEDLVHEYTAPWALASNMAINLQTYANELVRTAYNQAATELCDDDYSFDKWLGAAVKNLNSTYRGRYIECNNRNFNVKVPYYQLPLIFGDCFGDGSRMNYQDPNGKYYAWKAGSAGRTFSKTIGKSDMPSLQRWNSAASNLLFFRLTSMANNVGTYDQPRWWWDKSKKEWAYSWDKPVKFFKRVWKYLDDSRCSPSYITTGNANYPGVNWDFFDMSKGLQAVSEFKVLMYRVDAYNLSTGQYICDGQYTGGKSRGGGTWWVYETIGKDNKTAKNLYDMEAAIDEKNTYLRTHYDQPRPQAIFSYADNTLTFVYSDEIDPTATFKINTSSGRNIYHEESDFEELTWSSWKSSITKVKFDASFKKADIRTTSKWFYDYKNLVTIENIGNLNTSKVEDMSYMFYRCNALKTLDLRSWDVSKVKNVKYMFYNCKALTQVDMSGWKLMECTDMYAMFQGCSELTTVYMNVETPMVENMSYLFSNCEKLYNSQGDLSLNSFGSSSELTLTKGMFNNCKKLKRIFLRNMSGVSLTDCSNMFNGCSALTYLAIPAFAPADAGVGCGSIFGGISSSASAEINYAVPDKIRDQWPGKKTQTYDENIKVVYAQDASNSKYLLFFLRNSTDFKKNNTYTVVVNGTGRRFTVREVWNGYKVLATSTYPDWYKYLPNIEYAYIDATFSASPQSTSYWFAEAKNLKSIEGLSNLNTTRTTRMNNMFHNCKELSSWSMKFGKNFKTTKCTTMAGMFEGCEKVQEITGLNQVTSEVLTDISYMFYNCKALKNVRLGGGNSDKGFSTKNITKLEGLFWNCNSVESIYVLNNERWENAIDATSCTNLGRVFYGCGKCKSFPDLRNTDKVTDWYYMFRGCTLFRTTNGADGWYEPFYSMKSAKNVSGMFADCAGLKKLDLSAFDATNVTSATGMFNCCSGLTELNLSTFKPKSLSEYNSMFVGVPKTCTIYIPYDCTTNVLNQIQNPPYTNRVLIYPAYALIYTVGDHKEMTLLSTSTKYSVGGTFNGYKITNIVEGTDLLQCTNNYSSMFPSDVTKVTIQSSFSRVPLQSLKRYFYGMKKLTSITGLENLNISKVTSMKDMFCNCTSLTSVDLSGLNTSNVTDMSCMFMCIKVYDDDQPSSLKSIKFGGKFTTANVENLMMMFYGCESLTSLDVSSFNTAKCKNFVNMFFKCKSLTSLNISNFKTTGIQDGDGSALMAMFENCESLKTIKVGNLDMSKVTSTSYMFDDCKSLTELDLSSWNTASLKEMNGMFAGCENLRTLMLGSGFSVDKLKKYEYSQYISEPFKDVHDVTVIVPYENLYTVKEAMVNGQNFVIGKTGQFYDKMPSKEPQAVWTSSNKTLTFYYGAPVGSSFNGESVTQVWKGDQVLNNKSSSAAWISTVKNTLEKVIIDNSFINARPTSTRGWFDSCQKLKTIEGTNNLVTSSVTDMAYMFYNCTALSALDVTSWNTSNVTNMHALFWNTRLKEIDLTHFNTAKVTDMEGMFRSCLSLQKLDLSSFNTGNVTKASGMFSYFSVKELKVGSNFTMPKISSKQSAFESVKDCEIRGTTSVISSVKSTFRDKLGFVEGTHGLYVETDNMKAQAIWTADNKTLTFYYGRLYKKGEKFVPNGKTVTAVWSGNDVTQTSPQYVNGVVNAPWATTVRDYVTFVEFHESFKQCRPSKAYGWFYNFTKLTDVRHLENFNTVNTYDFDRMFAGCTSLRYINLSELKTPNASYMQSMFRDCKNMNKFDLSNFTTKNVTNMHHMFSGCTGAKTIDVSKFDTQKVTDMSCMFENCYYVTELDCSNWNTAKVTNMSGMFYKCQRLTTITGLSKLNTSSVTNMKSMFYDCQELAVYGAGSFKTSNVTDMSYMFYNCKKHTGFSMPNWNTEKVKDMSWMFYNNEQATMLETRFSTKNVTNMSHMFDGCKKLQTSSLSTFDTSKVTDMSYMFRYCGSEYSSKSLSVENFNTSNVTDMKYMFFGCKTVKYLSVYNWNTSKVTDMSYMFAECKALQGMNYYSSSFNLSKWNVSKVKTFDSMFQSTALKDINLTGWKPSACSNFSWIFYMCESLKELRMSASFTIPSGASVQGCFSKVTSCTVYPAMSSEMDTLKKTLKTMKFSGHGKLKYGNTEITSF